MYNLSELYVRKIINILLVFCFLISRIADYVTTYIMIKLGAKEINPTISYLISCFGVQKGILILFMLSLLISVLFVCVIIKAKDTNYSLLATLVLVLVLFFSIVAVTGNVCGFAYVLKNVI